MKERNIKNVTDQLGTEKYKRLKNSINRELRKIKEAFLYNIYSEINEQLKSGQMDKAYGMAKTFFKAENQNNMYLSKRKAVIFYMKNRKW